MMKPPVLLKVCLKLGVMAHASSHERKSTEARDAMPWEHSSESLEAISSLGVCIISLGGSFVHHGSHLGLVP